MKKLLLVILSALCILCLVSCGGSTDTDTNTNSDTSTDTGAGTQAEVNYKVTVLTEEGTPFADVIVYFGDKKVFADEKIEKVFKETCAKVYVIE